MIIYKTFLSSTLIKEASSLGADVSSFVPRFVEDKIKEKKSRQTERQPNHSADHQRPQRFHVTISIRANAQHDGHAQAQNDRDLNSLRPRLAW